MILDDIVRDRKKDYIEIIKFIKQLKEKQRIKRIVNRKFVIKKYNN